jgi:hypothetical protein
MVSAMDRWHFPAFILGVSLGAVSGCNSFHETHQPQYETVQADPRHETAVAEAEHAQALKFLNGTSICKECNPAKAEEHLQKALVADATYGPAHNTLGMLYLRQRRLYLAAWEFEYAQKLMPERFEPLYNLGLVYEAADKLDRAIEFYSMAFSISPRTPDVLESLARARLRNGETIANVRPLLKEILFYESRPFWVCWAKDRLGLAPEETAQDDVPAAPLPAGDRRSNNSHKRPPAPEPPLPDESSGPAPKVAAPNPVNQLSSTAGVRNDVFSELDQPASTDAPASAPLAIASKALSRGSDTAITPAAADSGPSSAIMPVTAKTLSPTGNGQPQSGGALPTTADSSLFPGQNPFGDETSNSSR